MNEADGANLFFCRSKNFLFFLSQSTTGRTFFLLLPSQLSLLVRRSPSVVLLFFPRALSARPAALSALLQRSRQRPFVKRKNFGLFSFPSLPSLLPCLSPSVSPHVHGAACSPRLPFPLSLCYVSCAPALVRLARVRLVPPSSLQRRGKTESPQRAEGEKRHRGRTDSDDARSLSVHADIHDLLPSSSESGSRKKRTRGSVFGRDVTSLYPGRDRRGYKDVTPRPECLPLFFVVCSARALRAPEKNGGRRYVHMTARMPPRQRKRERSEILFFRNCQEFSVSVKTFPVSCVFSPPFSFVSLPSLPFLSFDRCRESNVRRVSWLARVFFSAGERLSSETAPARQNSRAAGGSCKRRVHRKKEERGREGKAEENQPATLSALFYVCMPLSVVFWLRGVRRMKEKTFARSRHASHKQNEEKKRRSRGKEGKGEKKKAGQGKKTRKPRRHALMRRLLRF